jgi:hypothetical protein
MTSTSTPTAADVQTTRKKVEADHRSRPEEAARVSYHAAKARLGEAWENMSEVERYEYGWSKGFAYCFKVSSGLAPFVAQFTAMLAYLVDRMGEDEGGVDP